MAQKRCPQCRKLVDASATVCPFCGYVFPEESDDQVEKAKKNKGCLIIVALIVVVAIALAVITAQKTSADAPDTTAIEAVITEELVSFL